MKKHFGLFTLLIIALFLLASCGNGDDNSHKHVYGQWNVITQGSCTSNKIEKRNCSCGESETRITAAVGHIESDWIVKDPTATDDGYRYKECTVCSKRLAEEILHATGSIGLAYTINADKTTCTITGIGACEDTEVIIPEKIDGYMVTGIGDKAFSENKSITAVTIPKTVNAIGTRAFYACEGITEITIPDSVTEIGTQIFYKASNLNTVYYHSPYNDSSNRILAEPAIKKIVFGCNSIPWIWDSEYTKEIVLLDGITTIDSFSCGILTKFTFLDKVTIPASVKKIGLYAFNKVSIEQIHVSDIAAWCHVEIEGFGGQSGGFGEVCVNGEVLENIVIPDTVSKINHYVFAGCSLKSVVISDSVTFIGIGAFEGCTELESITIPNSVKTICPGAFSECSNLESINYDGTIEEWKNIIKDNYTGILGGGDWYDDTLKYIICTDETIEI